MVICLERCADLHMAQMMPLPLTVSCSNKVQICFTFLVPAHPVSPGQRAVKRVCVCVCVKQVRAGAGVHGGCQAPTVAPSQTGTLPYSVGFALSAADIMRQPPLAGFHGNITIIIIFLSFYPR